MIIGISGKKQSGKGVLSDWLVKKITDNGGTAKIYSYAAHLKRFCVDILGLDEAQVYGSDDYKNTLTKYKWENMPFYEAIVLEHAKRISNNDYDNLKNFKEIWKEAKQFVPQGFMRARDVMQTFGTEIGRRMYSNIWVDALMRQLDKERNEVQFQIIDDVRFPNEADAVKERGESLVRLTRKINDDKHASETALDNYPFDDVIDNQNISREEFINQLENWWEWSLND